MKKILFTLILITLLVGCSKNNNNGNTIENNTQTAENTAGYQFDYQGVTMSMNDNAAAIVDALGEPMDYFEAPSCAFQGLDKIYYYSGFDLSTYPGTDGDYISAIEFTDDSVSTKEGIFIGNTRDEVIKTYGNDYTEESGSLTYTKGKTKLTFLIENNAVTSINYEFITD
ncbi:hypothetical protein Ana3638_04565 [Anaerocolumna sedimenticola]|uniref:DUF4309 domain-containing protein n=1 Tax=Anaerocolumna sedimenticola TaxID=2696063 RepID=A0A6P1TI82_9FIRM|nr:hypothetical protein [Anaerocolumna sedimenticola]QHQ60143.1 hypothetical protein Ana3638_04565 [Anaerocolumna sedimenticola]